MQSDKNSNLVRLLFVALAVYLLSVAFGNFYRHASSPTDENWFNTSPSHLYVTKSFPARFVSTNDKSKILPDSVLAGDLLMAVNDHHFSRQDSVQAIFANLTGDSPLILKIFRPALDKNLTFETHKSALADNFFRTIPPTVFIYEVFPGGASDLAGIKVGDLVININEQTFQNAIEADKILRQAKTGATIVYRILRNNQILTIPVKLASFGFTLSTLIVLVAGLIYWGTGSFIAVSRPNHRAAQLLGLTFLMFGFFLMVFTIQRDPEYDLLAKARDVTTVASLPLAIATWLHSKYHFPTARPEILRRAWIIWIPYAVALAALFILNVIKRPIRAWPATGMLIILMLAYHFVTQFAYRKQRSPEALKLQRWVFWTGATSLILAVAMGVLLNFTKQARQIGFIGIPLVFIPLVYLYTIGRYQLLDMNLRIRRNIQYIIVSTIWVAALVVIFLQILLWLPDLEITIPNLQFTGTSIVIMDEPPQPNVHDFLEKIILMSAAVTLTFVFFRISKGGQKFIDHRFHRDRQTYSRAASELAEVMATKLNMDDLARGVVEKLAKVMQLKKVGVLFFRNEQSCGCYEAHGFDGAKWDEFCIHSDHQLIAVIQKFRSESRLSASYLPNNLKEKFQQLGIQHLIPIRFKEKLVGSLLIGEKLSETPLHLEDLTFLTAVSKQASIAIENAFLHEDLAVKERLKHELELARRIQMASLPQSTPHIPGLDIAGVSIPALEVGGDYFDYLNGFAHEITIIIGDVSGKGTSAALYMSKVQGILRSLHQFKLSPRELFIRANQLLCRDLDKNSFITAIGAYLNANQRQLVLARAGHLPLFYYRARMGKVELITPRGLGLGLESAEIFADEMEEKMIAYESDDVFLFVTDGVTEAKSHNGLEFGEERLVKILEANSSASANQIRDQLLAEVKRFAADALPHDDQTVVVVKAI
jgi:sigma-B regulation protein RsbU (phosphoserine phosphatase)